VKALYFEEHGGTDKLRYGDRPEPEPGAGEVRVRLRASALNHLDLFVLGGMPGVPIGLPHIGGADGAGVVDAVGDSVEGVELGTEVVFDPGLSCGRCEYCRSGEQSLCVRFGVLGEHSDGTFAEAVVVAADSLAPRPSHLSWNEAAAFGLTYLTAWRMLMNRGRLSPGETVLIHGIGGNGAHSRHRWWGIAGVSAAGQADRGSDDCYLALRGEARSSSRARRGRGASRRCRGGAWSAPADRQARCGCCR